MRVVEHKIGMKWEICRASLEQETEINIKANTSPETGRTIEKIDMEKIETDRIGIDKIEADMGIINKESREDRDQGKGTQRAGFNHKMINIPQT